MSPLNELNTVTNYGGQMVENEDMRRELYLRNQQINPTSEMEMTLEGFKPIEKEPPKQQVKQKPRRKAKRVPTPAELDTGNPVSKPEPLDPALEAAHKKDLSTKGIK